MRSYVALCESVLHAGLARGHVDVDALAQIVQAFHRPAEPLQAAAPHLPALVWALAQVPAELGVQDTIWVVADHTPGFNRIGPAEWARGGGYAELRRVALALGVMAASSRQLRQQSEDVLGELIAELASQRLGEVPASDFAERVAYALALEPSAVADAIEQVADFLPRLLTLAQQPFVPILKSRGIEAGPHSARGQGLWRELLQSLSALDPDRRPLVVWLAPLWVADLVSPYTREVQPLLARWAREQAQLPALADAIAQGDADATYMCANLFDDAEVLAEREDADASCGIFTIADPDGIRLAKVIDTSRLDLSLVDSRLGVEELETPAPIVLVLNGADVDTGYALERLLCDVNASYRAISVCIAGTLTGEETTLVGSARMALTAQGPLILAAPADLAPVRPLGLPDLAYALVFGDVGECDAVFELHRAAQDALGQALWRGDLGDTPIHQRFWLEPRSDAALLEAKRAHIADALRLWRAFLGVPEAAPLPEPPQKKRPKAGSLRFRA